MKRLYNMSREQLLFHAGFFTNSLDPELFHPFTNQQLRDYITNKAVERFIEQVQDETL